MKSVSFHPKIKLIYSEKSDGNLDKRFSTPEIFRQNRKTFFKTLKLQPYQIIEAAQVHGDRILKLDSENTKMWRGHNVTGVDGFITNQTDSYLMIRVADCVPLVFYDPDHHALGLIHAGWRGLVKDIHLKAVDMLTKWYDSQPAHLLTWIGPSARDCCFISAESPDQTTDPSWKPYTKKRFGGWTVDLVGYLTDTLKGKGVLKKHMVLDPQCTVDSESLFSHIRSKTKQEPPGRFAVIAHLIR
jgi:polyphenol oxidase